MKRTERNVNYVEYSLTPNEVRQAIVQFVQNNKTDTDIQGIVSENYTLDILENFSAVLTNVYK